MAERALKSGEVAALAGVNVETVRYYEKRGILDEPPRGPSGYREYSRGSVRVIRFVKRAQQLGFTLDECQELLVLRGDETRACAEVRDAASAKVADIDVRIRDLQRMKRALNTLISSCTGDASTRECPILDALDEPAEEAGVA